jgi:hypothetical protein
MAHDRFSVSCVQFRGFIEHLLLVDGHSRVLTKMFSPGGYHVVQTEQAGMIQAFVNPALEGSVPPACGLNFFHQSSNTLASHKRQNTGFRSANQAEVDLSNGCGMSVEQKNRIRVSVFLRHHVNG